MIEKVISGGQTGVDRAALDAAIACGIPHGGWIPAGRRTEGGPLSLKYTMQEMSSSHYPDRTRRNVMESDATLIISRGPLLGGSALTADIARQNNVPWMHLNLAMGPQRTHLAQVKEWLCSIAPATLNVAGPRASSDVTIYRMAYLVLVELFALSSLYGRDNRHTTNGHDTGSYRL